jgi:hypothetical protein
LVLPCSKNKQVWKLLMMTHFTYCCSTSSLSRRRNLVDTPPSYLSVQHSHWVFLSHASNMEEHTENLKRH